YGTLQHAVGFAAAKSLWEDTNATAAATATRSNEASGVQGPAVIDALASAAAILTHHDRLPLVATELVEVLRKTAVFTSVGASIRRKDGSGRDIGRVTTTRTTRTLRAATPQGTLELSIDGAVSAESISILQSMTAFMTALSELEHARFDQAVRARLWTDVDAIDAGEQSVISGHMREVMTFARRVAKTNVTVLITGESGTGKEILARALHDASNSANKPFAPFNCTAIPRDLLESHLFGHRRGAFTGADRDQLGLVRAARDGTLFLDEIGELGLDLQPKLLRFLESGEIAPLGETGPTTVTVRIVAATNRNLEELVRADRFREDLFYRLNVVRLTVKPLRERRDEIPGLIAAFVARAADEFNKGNLTVSEETMDRLLLYRWPGNVRQ